MGKWRIEEFKVSEQDAFFYNLRNAVNGRTSRNIVPGTYYKLMRGSVLVMSNTPAELRDHAEIVKRAENAKTVLVAGLGLGMVIKDILESPIVEKITVVEIEKEVIDLVSIDDPRVEIINQDIFDFEPGIKYDVAWFDIWDNICGDNADDFNILREKFKDHANWVGFWCEQEIKELAWWEEE